ncbi:hypothetical protein [Chitinivorax sp. B]|uniref:hypothetical protein n=1 Tax=Chitinivorax sp. B TaxID=2502235 RepID=UPI0010F96B81|nr:hypothetical protein [Chitinivorax sp. B]
MSKLRITYSLLVVAAIGTLAWLNGHEEQQSVPSVVKVPDYLQDSADETPLQIEPDVGKSPFLPTAVQSPFPGMPMLNTQGGKVAGEPDIQLPTPEEVAQKQQMEKLGYLIPPEYYQMELSALRELAEKGDTFALVHLGERYYFDIKKRQSGPDFEAGVDYTQLAIKSLAEALARGNAHSAAMISEIYLVENKPVEATAWNLIAERMGDQLSVDWFRRTKDYQQLSANDRRTAAQQAEQLQQALEQQRASLVSKSRDTKTS